MTPSPLIKVTAVAKQLGLSRQTVHSLIHSGDLIAVSLAPSRRRVQRVHRLVTRASLDQFWARRSGRAGARP